MSICSYNIKQKHKSQAIEKNKIEYFFGFIAFFSKPRLKQLISHSVFSMHLENYAVTLYLAGVDCWMYQKESIHERVCALLNGVLSGLGFLNVSSHR